MAVISERWSQWVYAFIAVILFSVPSWGKTTHPQVQLNIMCLICGPNVRVSSEASLKLVRIRQWKNKIKIAINFHRDAITGDVVIASCSDMFAEWGIVLNCLFFFLLLLFCPCSEALPRAAALCCNLKHQTRGNKSWTQMSSVWKHGTSEIASEMERVRERVRASGKSTDGPSFNTSVPQLSCQGRWIMMI